MSERESPLKVEALRLYRTVLRSLDDGTTVYLIDDYLSEVKSLTRNPTRSGASTTYFSRGGPSSRSLTYLVRVGAGYSNSLPSAGSSAELGDRNLKYLAAIRVVSSALAMKMVSADPEAEMPITVSLILFGDMDVQRDYQYFNVRRLKEAMFYGEDSSKQMNHVVVVEPTGLRVCNLQKGCLIFRLTIKGDLHKPAFLWLGESPWDALARFQNSVDSLMRPRHDVYPVEFGKAQPTTLSNFLIGYPTAVTTQVRSNQWNADEGKGSIESHHYMSLPPEFSHEELMRKLIAAAKEIEKSGGCQISINEEYIEEPFLEDPHSLVVGATSKAVLRTSGFEPIFEWLPYPVSARELKTQGFVKDIVVFGPGEWTSSSRPNEKSAVQEIVKTSRILAMIPAEVATLLKEQSKNRLG